LVRFRVETAAFLPRLIMESAMTSPVFWLIMLGPMSLLCAASLGRLAARNSVFAMNRLATIASLFAVLVAFASALGVMAESTLATGLVGAGGIGFSVYIDSVSAAMFLLVSFIGLIVVNYSRNYLDGDPRQLLFTRFLCLTIATVLFAIVSGNLFQFALAWIAMSMSLHELLIFYPERPAAILAARKKFLAARIGDVSLVAALVLLYAGFGTLDYATLFAGATALHAEHTVPGFIHAAALLLVVTGLLKSAQFPSHGWIIEVMETPTPVSALLHAGIVNAGGFLILRFAHVIALSLPALDTLAIIGGFTALFGSVVMLTQTSIKVSLAYSTIAQMGFMMLECGLGAFSAAMLHIFAHSLYKAHAFLSSGSVIDIARASWTPSPGGKPHPWRLVFAIIAVLFVTVAVSRIFGATLDQKPGVFALGAVLLLGIIHLVANGIDERPNFYVVYRTLAYAAVAAIAYFSLQSGAEWVLARALPVTQAQRGPFGIGMVAIVVLSFATVTFLLGLVPTQPRAPRWQALYAHVSNGFYVNTLANRLVVWLWPSPPRSSSPIAV
jgi:NAD(P)H-quinone oxidoreductase subunit 5